MAAPPGAKEKHPAGVFLLTYDKMETKQNTASTSAARKLPFWNIQQVLRGEGRQPLSFHISLVRTWRSAAPALSTRCTSEGDEDVENTISVSSLGPSRRTRAGGVNVRSHGVSQSARGAGGRLARRLSPHVSVSGQEVADTRARCELAARYLCRSRLQQRLGH